MTMTAKTTRQPAAAADQPAAPDKQEAVALVGQAVSEYFLLLDELGDPAALADLFTEDAVWECYDRTGEVPILAVRSKEHLAQIMQVARFEAAGDRVKHHLTGLVVDEVSADRITARAKVLVTIQRDGSETPVPRNTALCHGEWRRLASGWKAAHWTIRRHSQSEPRHPAPVETSAPSPTPRPAEGAPSSADKALVERYFADVVDGRSEDLASFFSANCTVHRCELPVPIRGLSQLAEFFRLSRSNLAETRTQIEDIVSEGGRVVARVRHRATFAGALLTPLGVRDVRGRKVEWTAVAWFEIRDGRIASEWVHRDEVGIYGQLGVIDEVRKLAGTA